MRSTPLIAEVKKASPSVGTIVENFDPVAIAQMYETSGAHAVSRAYRRAFFQGHLSFATKVRSAITLPVLQKDFIVHEVQIYEAACAGADAILLIVAALEQEQLTHLQKVAALCQLEVLVEVHTLEEMDRALESGAQIIGINNRNLATFEVDLAATERISEEATDDIILISESGIKTPADARRVFDAGANAILVGEATHAQYGCPRTQIASAARRGRSRAVVALTSPEASDPAFRVVNLPRRCDVGYVYEQPG